MNSLTSKHTCLSFWSLSVPGNTLRSAQRMKYTLKVCILVPCGRIWFTVNCKSTYWNFSLAVRCDHTVKLLKRITVPSKCCFHGTYLGQNGLQFLMLQLPNTLLKLLLGNSFISNLKVTQESRLLPLSSIIWPDSTKHPLYHFCFK